MSKITEFALLTRLASIWTHLLLVINETICNFSCFIFFFFFVLMDYFDPEVSGFLPSRGCWWLGLSEFRWSGQQLHEVGSGDKTWHLIFSAQAKLLIHRYYLSWSSLNLNFLLLQDKVSFSHVPMIILILMNISQNGIISLNWFGPLVLL